MTDKTDIDNVRYSFETQEFFQRQIEEAINTLINEKNTENNKAYSWFLGDQMTSNIKDYSTTQSSNTTLNTINVGEGMLPSNLNNAIRALMKNTRDWFNDAQWIEYGDGDGSYTAAYASATSFTINGSDVTSVYHAGRRI